MDSVLYRIVVLLHIGVTIVGFGGMIASGMANAKAFRGPASIGGVLLDAGRSISKTSEYAIYAILPLGIVLVALSESTFSMGDGWISASFVVWFAVVGVIHGLIRPSVKTMAGRAEALGNATTLDADPESTAASKKLMIGEGGLQLLLVAALFLMIWRPGAGG